MPFSFDLPDPDSSAIQTTRAPDGSTAVSATPEVAASIEGAIRAQDEALHSVMGGIAQRVGNAIEGQSRAIAATTRPIAQTIERQIAGQSAAVENALSAVRDNMERTVGQISEKVGNVAVAAALQPRQRQYTPSAPRPSVMGDTAAGGAGAIHPLVGWRAPGTAGGAQSAGRPGARQNIIGNTNLTVGGQSGGGENCVAVPGMPGNFLCPGGGSQVIQGEGNQNQIQVMIPPPPPPPPPPPQCPPDTKWAILVGKDGCPLTTVPLCPLPMLYDGEWLFGEYAGQNEPAMDADVTRMMQECGKIININPPPPPPPEPCRAPAYPPPCRPGDMLYQQDNGDGTFTECCLPAIITQPECPPGMFPPPCRPGDTIDPVSGCCIPPDKIDCPPPKDCPVPPPPPSCPWDVMPVLPPVGSPEWCAQMPNIRRSLARLGSLIMDLAFSVGTNGTGVLAGANLITSVIGGAGGGTALVDWASELINYGLPIIGQIKQIVVCWKKLATMVPACDADEMVSIAVLRGVIRALQHLRVGTDIAAWVTIDLTFELPAVERACEYVFESMCPTWLPDPKAAWEAWKAGFITEEIWRCWTLGFGEDPDTWTPARMTDSEVMKIREVIMTGRLQGLTPKEIDTNLQQRGWWRDEDRDLMEQLYDRPPAPGQMMVWVRNGANSDAQAMQLTTDEGFVGWWEGPDGELLRAQGVTEYVAHREWRSNWRVPEFVEWQQYWWRLRPDKVGADAAFTDADAQAIMTFQGMTRKQKQWASASANRPLDVGTAVTGVSTGLADDGWIRSTLLDTGLTVPDAELATKWVSAAAWATFTLNAGGWTLANTATMLRAGLTLAPDALIALEKQGLTATDAATAARIAGEVAKAAAYTKMRTQSRQRAAAAVLDGYRVGLLSSMQALDAMNKAGMPDDAASTMISTADVTVRTAATKRMLLKIKRGLLRGELTRQDALTIMTNAGITTDAATRYSAEWQIEAWATRPMASVVRIRKWVEMGLLPLAAAQLRLQNLGWTDPDLTLLIAQWGAELATAAAKARAKGVAEQQAAIRAAERVKAQALRQLEKRRPIAALARWYKDGEISRGDVEDQLTKYGYDKESIALYLSGWDFQAAKKKGPAADPKPKAPPTAQQQVSVSTIGKWLKAGIVTEEWARARLVSYGYDGIAVEGYIEQWTGARPAPAGA